ncbi:MAG: hypothetical protein IT458_05685 [Planctomycetes bacterium]|nr:hypothetical protein [Planctomycetota bacterium]
MPRLLVASLLALAPTMAAQGVGAAFPMFENSWGNSCNLLPYGQTLHRWQQLYEAAALPVGLTPGKQIRTVGWRRCGDAANYPSAPIDIEVGVYSVPFAQAGMSATFATNRTAGTGGVAFTRKVYNLPAMPLGNPTNTYARLPLDTPHVFAGPNLLVEVVAFGATVVSTNWRADMCSGTTGGGAGTFGTKCGPTTNTINSTGTYLPGNTITITEASGPVNAAAVAMIGFSQAALGPIPLPYALGGLGFTGCNLYQSADVGIGSTLSAAGGGSLPLPLPANPALNGVSFGAQWVNLDPASPGGASFTAGRRITLGPIPCPGAYLYRLSDNLDTTGSVFTNRGQVMILTWQ